LVLGKELSTTKGIRATSPAVNVYTSWFVFRTTLPASTGLAMRNTVKKIYRTCFIE
jgi:hypothetical protein